MVAWHFVPLAGTKRRGEDRPGKVVQWVSCRNTSNAAETAVADLGLVNDILDAYGNVPSVVEQRTGG
jgi:hypothetical protein